jgi:NSS family neurotransmitter:Na+ symporter
MNQAFFTLGLGIGSMSIFGSYIGRSRTLLGEALNVTALDTFVAILAGLVIFPACSAFGVRPDSGPGLVFVTLPNVFNSMPLGRVWGAAFFAFMFAAAMSTVLAIFENIIACTMDMTGWTRRRAALACGIAMPFLSTPCALGFNLLSDIHPFGGESTILDLEDFLVSDLALPLGSLAFAVYCTRRIGWGWKPFLEETNAGRGIRLSSRLHFLFAWVVPAAIAVVMVAGLHARLAAQ